MMRLLMPANRKIVQLMTDRATQGLSDHDQGTLNAWFDAHPNQSPSALEFAAALATLGFGAEAHELMPNKLCHRIRSDAVAFFQKELDGRRRHHWKSRRKA